MRPCVARRVLRAALMVSVVVLATACVDRGATVSDQRAVGGFSSISASNGVEVRVTLGGTTQTVMVTTGEKLLPDVVTRVEGDTLVVTMEGSAHRDVVIDISTPSVSGIDASSSAKVTIDGVAGPSFKVNTSSQAEVEATGSPDALDLSGSSQSKARLGGLQVARARVNLSSQATGEIRATDSVTGDVSSGGKLTILGSPNTVDVSTSSDGKVDQG